MYKLGITGGIGSGKTTASNYLSLKSKVYVFNADKESKLQTQQPLPSDSFSFLTKIKKKNWYEIKIGNAY